MKGVDFIDSVPTEENSCSTLLGNYGSYNNENGHLEEVLCAPKKNWEIGKK